MKKIDIEEFEIIKSGLEEIFKAVVSTYDLTPEVGCNKAYVDVAAVSNFQMREVWTLADKVSATLQFTANNKLVRVEFS